LLSRLLHKPDKQFNQVLRCGNIHRPTS